MPPTLSTMSRLGARGPKSHGTSKMLDNFPTGHKANIPWPSPSCWYFLGFFRKSTNSTTSSGSWRANWKYKRKFTTNGGKKDHCFQISVFWWFSTASKIIDLSISFCLSEGLDFGIFSSPWPWRNSENAKLQLLLDPAPPHRQTSPLRFCLSEISSCWSFRPCWCWQIYQIQGGPFNHLILILRVYDQPEVSWLLLLHFAMSCQAMFCQNSPSYHLPNFAGKESRSGHNPIIGVPKKSIPKRSKKQTNHIEKKKKKKHF